MCAFSILPTAESKPTYPRIWLAFPPSADYMQLFEDESAWPVTLNHLDVFVLQTTFATEAGDPTLRKIFAFLDRHNIALGLEMPILLPGPNDRGIGIEEYRRPEVIPALMAKIKRLGGHLKYVTMDEPLWFGHFSTQVKPDGSSACHMSIHDVAANVARNVSVIESYFPDVIIGDEEPIANQFRSINDVPPNYWEQLTAWTFAFHQATGRHLAYEMLDIGWFPTGDRRIDPLNGKMWPTQLGRGMQTLQRLNIPTGIFYNGNPQDATGFDWIKNAEQRFMYVETKLGFHFDNVEFSTWMKQPKLLLPETSQDRMTNLIKNYLSYIGEISK